MDKRLPWNEEELGSNSTQQSKFATMSKLQFLSASDNRKTLNCQSAYVVGDSTYSLSSLN